MSIYQCHPRKPTQWKGIQQTHGAILNKKKLEYLFPFGKIVLIQAIKKPYNCICAMNVSHFIEKEASEPGILIQPS